MEVTEDGQAPQEAVVDEYPRVPVERLLERYATEENKRNTNILTSLMNYNEKKAEPIETLPVIDGQVLDVARLFVKVTGGAFRGADAQTQLELWRPICQHINIDERHAAYIQQYYTKWLLPYETGLRLYKKKQAEMKQQGDQGKTVSDGTAGEGTASEGGAGDVGAGEAASSSSSSSSSAGSAVDKLVLPQPQPAAPSSSSGAGGGDGGDGDGGDGGEGGDPAASQDPAAAAAAAPDAAAGTTATAAAKPLSRYMLTKQRKEAREREARAAQQQAQQHHQQQMGLGVGYPVYNTMAGGAGALGAFPRPMLPYPIPGAYGLPQPGHYAPQPQMASWPGQQAQQPQHQHQQHQQVGNVMLPDVLAATVADLMAEEVATVIRGLNTVVVRSFDHDPNTVLHLEAHPDLVNALGGLLEAVNPVGNLLFPSTSVPPAAVAGSKRKQDAEDARYVEALITEKKDEAFTWDAPMPSSPYVSTLVLTLNDNHILQNAVLAVRNFSFEVCNETTITASYLAMKHLVSLVVASYGAVTMPDPCQHAFDTLVNIASRLDLTGTKRLSQSRWLENVLGDSRTHPHGRTKVPMHQTHASKHDYLEVTKALAAYVFASVRQTVDRTQIARGLELLVKLAGNEANKPVFTDVPTDMLEDLVALLCVNLTETEPLVVAEATVPGLRQASILGYTQERVRANFTRIPACETATFFEVLSDVELRDMALEAIHTMCTLCPDLLPHFARVPHFLTVLLRICALRIARGERYEAGPAKAAAIAVLLAQRATDRDVRGRFKAVYMELVTGAAWNDCLADIFATVAPLLDVVDDVVAPFPGASGDGMSQAQPA